MFQNVSICYLIFPSKRKKALLGNKDHILNIFYKDITTYCYTEHKGREKFGLDLSQTINVVVSFLMDLLSPSTHSRLYYDGATKTFLHAAAWM